MKNTGAENTGRNIEAKELRNISLITGISLLVMAIVAMLSFGMVLSNLYIENDPAQTLINIEANRLSYTLGNIGWIIVLITDVIVTVGLYLYLKPINKTYAIISGTIRLIYSAILAVAIVFLFMKNVDMFNTVWNFGLFIFGFHLVATGLGFHKDTKAQKSISNLLVVAGVGYAVVSGLYTFAPGLNSIAEVIEMVMVLPMTIGELSLAFWLVIKGGKAAKDKGVTSLPDVV